MPDQCQSCGAKDSELSQVKRIYLEIDPFEKTILASYEVDEIEWWCLACQSMYPNRLVDHQ